MPSPRSRPLRRVSFPRLPSLLLFGLVATLGVGLAGACATGGGRPAVPQAEPLPNLRAEERSYLADPLQGYPLVVTAEVEAALRAGHRALLDEAATERARTAAREQLEADPGLHPAQVLWAQVEYAEGAVEAARRRLRPVTAELPGYLAAQLLRGRIEERLGEPVEAYRAFRAVAADSPLAADRAAELEPRALERLGERVEEALARGRLDEATAAVEQLRSWGPSSIPTLEAEADLAAARGDAAAELEALRRLTELRPDDRALQERRADLELEAGEPGRGLEIFETLAVAYPRDEALADKLAYAKFRWRLTLMPETVQELAGRPELQRGDYAVLLYWLLPSVRYGEPERARIAADILDDPRRDEIARVVNLDLMEMDETLHRFSPLESVSRETVLAGQLKVLARAETPVACVQGLAPEPSTESVCATAVRCGLIERLEDCLPEAPVSGREALELLRRTLDLTSVRERRPRDSSP